MSDHVLIIAISLGCSAGVCVLGAGLVWVLRRRSLRWGIAVVALVAVGSFVHPRRPADHPCVRQR